MIIHAFPNVLKQHRILIVTDTRNAGEKSNGTSQVATESNILRIPGKISTRNRLYHTSNFTATRFQSPPSVTYHTEDATIYWR